ncbi:hypothetical protein AWJ20_1878 [Sugiyamaella lignohabitans]|uniref:Uncharacterized protein n=1 Tax=Sugiyamaella lignohabitans TaxID=796027 RepID=A0A167E344_9ASCO|nr:uncharacterized protein AWJ20_1878 [Sugiyamaella lignohabitans]ANB13581.1 hypothetical protein AWJ20_1878 [Sugiyamaella lignohabitans]
MAIFRRSSRQEDQPIVAGGKTMVHSKKLSNQDIHDPILTAIHSEQPFEVSTNDPNTVRMSPEGAFRDIFGNTIHDPDRSNPSRPRNERPLDTIRSFEYACTGDERLRDEMETARLGWSTRRDFSTMPRFDTNPYAAPSSSGNVINFGDGSSKPETSIYTRPLAADTTEKKKKKRGLFGRKK